MEKKENIGNIPTVTPQRLMLRKIKDILLFLLPIAVVYALLFVIFFSSLVPSNSMAPAIPEGSVILGSRLVYQGGRAPSYGDIILFKKGHSTLIKRIIGIPGDTINLQGGHIYLNNNALVEDYIPQDSLTYPLANGMVQFDVPPGCYFVLGDNREESMDSRYWEQPYILKSNIIGKVSYTGKVFSSDGRLDLSNMDLHKLPDFTVVETVTDMPALETQAPPETIPDSERFKKPEETDAPATTLPVQPLIPSADDEETVPDESTEEGLTDGATEPSE